MGRPTRAAALGVACAVVATLVTASVTSSARLGESAPVVKRTAPLREAPRIVPIPRLHDISHQMPPPLLARNLFLFHASRPMSAIAPAMPVPAPQSAPAVPAPSGLALIGIAADSQRDDAVRTAIISRAGELFLAKEGDQVTDRYLVLKISGDAAELVEASSGAPLRLTLQ